MPASPPGGSAAAASPRAGPGPPSAGRPASPGCRGRAPRATRPAGPGPPAARPRSGRGVAEGDGDPVELGHQVGREAVGQLADRLLVDLPEPAPAGLVEGRLADLLEQLLDHRADAHHLGRLLDRLGRLLGVVPGRPRAPSGPVPSPATRSGGRRRWSDPDAPRAAGPPGRRRPAEVPSRSGSVMSHDVAIPAEGEQRHAASRPPVSEPWRAARRVSPVSAGSMKAMGAKGIRATSPSLSRPPARRGPPNHPSSTTGPGPPPRRGRPVPLPAAGQQVPGRTRSGVEPAEPALARQKAGRPHQLGPEEHHRGPMSTCP